MNEFFHIKRYSLNDLAGWCVSSFLIAALLKYLHFAPSWMQSNLEMGFSYLTTFIGLSLYSYFNNRIRKMFTITG
jgi:hypothetical protein